MILRLVLAGVATLATIPFLQPVVKWVLAKWGRRLAMWWVFVILQAWNFGNHVSGRVHDGKFWTVMSCLGVLWSVFLLVFTAYYVDDRKGRT